MSNPHIPSVEEQNTAYSYSTMGKEEILERLRERGYRITRQRVALLEVILERECSCCKEIYFQVHKTMPTIGIATIYRMINTLEEIGAIRRKNLYQIALLECYPVKNCIVEYSGGTQICLSGEKLHRVVEEGMKNLGLSREKAVRQIIAVNQPDSVRN
ncbi:MAG: Fur family transcriptional regulator [Lachnospiraceae bacterium]